MIKIKLEERHLDAAIEARKNTPEGKYCNTGSCFVAQAAREQVDGFRACGFTTLEVGDERDLLHCRQRALMDELTFSFDTEKYDHIRKLLAKGPIELTFGRRELQ